LIARISDVHRPALFARNAVVYDTTSSERHIPTESVRDADGREVMSVPPSVAGAAEDGAIADVEGRAVCRERDDMVDGQVGGGVGGTLVARAPVPVLTTPRPKHSRTEALPGPRAVQRVVPAAVGLPGVVGAAATRAAGDDTTDRAELHPRIVD